MKPSQDRLANISISIVSHRQAQLVQSLLADLRSFCTDSAIEIILTINIEEQLQFDPSGYTFPVRIIRNRIPKGYGANHNAAFRFATGDFFCVLNPDVRLTDNPFPVLTKWAQEAGIGLVAPVVVNSEGRREDSARRFPTMAEIIRKLFGGRSVRHDEETQSSLYPDWVAGMFMLVPTKVFEEICGFDERFYLYYEDVDLCARLTLAGHRIMLCATVSVVHEARRASHRKLRYLWWHVTSMVKYFSSPVSRQVRRKTLAR
jgi:GT2 family glycosyltransferase